MGGSPHQEHTCCTQITDNKNTITDCSEHCMSVQYDSHNAIVSEESKDTDYPDISLSTPPEFSCDSRSL